MAARLQLAIFARVLLATLLGYLIGLEREYRGKPAGERTFALLSLGAAALVALGVERFPLTGDRVVQGVVTGVGLLCAGIIFRASGPPHGLTTAVAAWAATAIGVLCGATLYLAAGLTTLLTIGILEAQQLAVVRGVRKLGKGRSHEDDDTA
jgi:putative Mg2+ transporter-C (MgtC) family protein